jgi:hypothetical protein
LSQFGKVGGIPGSRGRLQGFALLVAPHIAPENIDDVAGAWLMFGAGHAVEFVGEFSWYFDDARH